MSKLSLSFACGLYDRTVPLLTKQVQPEGIDLNYMTLDVNEVSWRMIHHEDFDVSEFSLGAYMIMLGRDDRRFVAIPVFPSRVFRHSAVFINKNAGIKTAADLKGKRIGVPDYTMTAAVWIRGFFQDDFHIRPTDVKWYCGGLDIPGRKQRISFNVPKDLHLEYIGDEKTLGMMLARGEIDAVIGASVPKVFDEGCETVIRLWPDYVNEEINYYKRTGYFPIMHTIIVKRQILEQYPWVAQNLFKAFAAAKELTQKNLPSLGAPKCMVPWYTYEYERAVHLMGKDFWPYGYAPNKKILEAFARFCHEQELSDQLVDVSKAFAQSTL